MPGITTSLRALRIDAGFFHNHLAHVILPFAEIEPGLQEGRRKENKWQSRRAMDQRVSAAHAMIQASNSPDSMQISAHLGSFRTLPTQWLGTSGRKFAMGSSMNDAKHFNKPTPRLSSRAPGVVPSIARRNDVRAWRSGDPSSRRW